MNSDYKWSILGRNLLIFLIFSALLLLISPFFEREVGEVEVDLVSQILNLGDPLELVTFQENSLVSLSNPANPEPESIQKIKVVITGYSSTPWETDDSPYITAAGTWVRDGIVANNKWPFGTQIRIPEIFGDKIFVVEDRMHWRKGNYHVDVWFPSYWEALNFGAKRTYIEILEN